MALNNDVLDSTSALYSVGGDAEFLGEIAGMVEAALPTLLLNIQDALSAGDLRAVERKAHLVKRAAQNVSAKRATGTALALEELARCGDLEAARQAACELGREVVRLQSALAAIESPMPYAMPLGCADEPC